MNMEEVTAMNIVPMEELEKIQKNPFQNLSGYADAAIMKLITNNTPIISTNL